MQTAAAAQPSFQQASNARVGQYYGHTSYPSAPAPVRSNPPRISVLHDGQQGFRQRISIDRLNARVGATTTTTPQTGSDFEKEYSGLGSIYTLVSYAGTAIGAYHGYGRNGSSIGWAIGWALLGGIFPFIVIPIALYQGLGVRAKG